MKSISNRLRPHRILLMAGILALSCGAIYAQNDDPSAGGPPPGEMRQRGPNPERQLQQLTQRLSLTADQQTQVRSILADQRQKMEELRKSSPAGDASAQAGPPNRQQMEAIRNDSDAKINALLNDDQKTKFAAWQQERKQRMENRGGGEGGPPPPPSN
jgi:periplasmic protein CpxP/Spy